MQLFDPYSNPWICFIWSLIRSGGHRSILRIMELFDLIWQICPPSQMQQSALIKIWVQHHAVRWSYCWPAPSDFLMERCYLTCLYSTRRYVNSSSRNIASNRNPNTEEMPLGTSSYWGWSYNQAIKTTIEFINVFSKKRYPSEFPGKVFLESWTARR